MNAVADALAPLGLGPVDMPATPEKLWRLIQSTVPAPSPVSWAAE
jgi:carbon-monoxide dehydrogenase large subunit